MTPSLFTFRYFIAGSPLPRLHLTLPLLPKSPPTDLPSLLSSLHSLSLYGSAVASISVEAHQEDAMLALWGEGTPRQVNQTLEAQSAEKCTLHAQTLLGVTLEARDVAQLGEVRPRQVNESLQAQMPESEAAGKETVTSCSRPAVAREESEAATASLSAIQQQTKEAQTVETQTPEALTLKRELLASLAGEREGGTKCGAGGRGTVTCHQWHHR